MESEPEYAIVEIFGHRKHAGRVMEVEQYGAKMLRIDIPTKGDFANGFTSHFYGGASLFSVTPTDLATACKMNKPYESARLYHSPSDEDDDPDPDFEDVLLTQSAWLLWVWTIRSLILTPCCRQASANTAKSPSHCTASSVIGLRM